MRVSMSRPWPASVDEGHQLRAGSPIRIRNSGAVSSAMPIPPSSSARLGWRWRLRAHFSQACGEWYHVSLRASHLGRSMSRPMIASSTGRSVVESSTAAATTTRPPSPTLRVSISGVKSSAPNPTTTVSPDVTTAAPAVSMVLTAASRRRCPRRNSSRKRVTISSE